jgi:prolyl-tRNA editing enzyme YbaK/EbsC (Cys-tRNA(Pro) deacylase)
MHPTAQKVFAFLTQAGYRGEIVEHTESTRTAEEAAQAAHCEVAQIVKSLVFSLQPENSPILVLVSGSNRVHEKNLGRLLGGKLQRPDAAYVYEVTGFAIGGIPPIGHKTQLPTYLDEDLMDHATVWAAAGTPNAVFEIPPALLQTISNAQIICVK